MTIEECFKDPEKTSKMQAAIARGKVDTGSQTFDQHLADLVNAQVISMDVAKSAASNPSDFERAMAFD